MKALSAFVTAIVLLITSPLGEAASANAAELGVHGYTFWRAWPQDCFPHAGRNCCARMYSAHIARRREAITTVIGSSDAGNVSYSDRHPRCALCSSHAANTTQPATAKTRAGVRAGL